MELFDRWTRFFFNPDFIEKRHEKGLKILKVLEAIITEQPHLRIGQAIDIAMTHDPSGVDLFSIENDRLLFLLEQHYHKGQGDDNANT